MISKENQDQNETIRSNGPGVFGQSCVSLKEALDFIKMSQAGIDPQDLKTRFGRLEKLKKGKVSLEEL
jgi:hypothetical protein